MYFTIYAMGFIKKSSRFLIVLKFMTKDLTSSSIDRQNILNNRIALHRIQSALNVGVLEFNNCYYLTKKMVADFYQVDVRTIDNYQSNYEEELKHNGYILCKGNILKEFKLRFAHEIDFASKTTVERYS